MNDATGSASIAGVPASVPSVEPTAGHRRNVESGSADRIALWMLDPDYDGRSLFPRQVFFPMAGANDG